MNAQARVEEYLFIINKPEYRNISPIIARVKKMIINTAILAPKLGQNQVKVGKDRQKGNLPSSLFALSRSLCTLAFLLYKIALLILLQVNIFH